MRLHRLVVGKRRAHCGIDVRFVSKPFTEAYVRMERLQCVPDERDGWLSSTGVSTAKQVEKIIVEGEQQKDITLTQIVEESPGFQYLLVCAIAHHAGICNRVAKITYS